MLDRVRKIADALHQHADEAEHTGLNHTIHVSGSTYHASVLVAMGQDPQGRLPAMI